MLPQPYLWVALVSGLALLTYLSMPPLYIFVLRPIIGSIVRLVD